jgi:hypothetical protein
MKLNIKILKSNLILTEMYMQHGIGEQPQLLDVLLLLPFINSPRVITHQRVLFLLPDHLIHPLINKLHGSLSFQMQNAHFACVSSDL